MASDKCKSRFTQRTCIEDLTRHDTMVQVKARVRHTSVTRHNPMIDYYTCTILIPDLSYNYHTQWLGKCDSNNTLYIDGPQEQLVVRGCSQNAAITWEACNGHCIAVASEILKAWFLVIQQFHQTFWINTQAHYYIQHHRLSQLWGAFTTI